MGETLHLWPFGADLGQLEAFNGALKTTRGDEMDEELRKEVRREIIATLMVLLRLLSETITSGEDWGKKQEEFEQFWGRL